MHKKIDEKSGNASFSQNMCKCAICRKESLKIVQIAHNTDGKNWGKNLAVARNEVKYIDAEGCCCAFGVSFFANNLQNNSI